MYMNVEEPKLVQNDQKVLKTIKKNSEKRTQKVNWVQKKFSEKGGKLKSS